MRNSSKNILEQSRTFNGRDICDPLLFLHIAQVPFYSLQKLKSGQPKFLDFMVSGLKVAALDSGISGKIDLYFNYTVNILNN